MQTTLRLYPSHAIRLRFARVHLLFLRWLRARLREESPVIDPIEPAVKDRSGFRIRLL